jgi:AcrR family transcriptional regulator
LFNFALFLRLMDKRNLILNVAMELFGHKGFEGTSVREIALKSNINLAMINYYFGSKEKLFESVVEVKAGFLKEIFQKLIDDPELSDMEKIDVVIDSYIDRIFANSLFHHILNRELSLNMRTQMHEKIIGILIENVQIIKKVINNGIANGAFRKVDPELTVATIMGTVNQLARSEALCRRLIQKGKEFNPYESKKFKERVSDHLKQLMRTHLLKNAKI